MNLYVSADAGGVSIPGNYPSFIYPSMYKVYPRPESFGSAGAQDEVCSAVYLGPLLFAGRHLPDPRTPRLPGMHVLHATDHLVQLGTLFPPLLRTR